MFDKQLFGYDREQVEEEIYSLGTKIAGQQKDIDYLRKENSKLKKRMKKSNEFLESEKQ